MDELSMTWDLEELGSLQKRGWKRPVFFWTASIAKLSGYSLPYPDPAGLAKNVREWFRMSSRSCGNPALAPERFRGDPPPTAQVEHSLPVCSLLLHPPCSFPEQ